MFKNNNIISFPINTNNKKISPKKPKNGIDGEIDFKIKKEIHKMELKMKKQVQQIENQFKTEYNMKLKQHTKELSQEESEVTSGKKVSFDPENSTIILQQVTQHISKPKRIGNSFNGGSNINNIYYEDGPVSIGTNQPVIYKNNTNNPYEVLNSEPENEGLFGYSIAFDQGGTLAVVGAPSDTNNTGKVYYYKWLNGWKNLGSIQGTNEGDYFGNSVSCSNGLLAIGIPGLSQINIYRWDNNEDQYILNKYYGNIGGVNDSNEPILKIGQTLSICAKPNNLNDITYNLIGGDPENSIVYYWINEGLNDLNIGNISTGTPWPDSDGGSETLIGQSVQAGWSTNFSTNGIYAPLFIIGIPNFLYQTEPSVESGKVSILLFDNINNSQSNDQIDMYSQYINNGNHFGWSTALEKNNCDFFMVSSPDASNVLYPGLHGIIETFKITKNEDWEPSTGSEKYLVWKCTQDLSSAGLLEPEPPSNIFTNFGYSCSLDQNNNYLAVGAPDMNNVTSSTDISAQVFLYPITIPSQFYTTRGDIQTSENYEPYSSFITFDSPILFNNLEVNDDFDESFGESILIQSNSANMQTNEPSSENLYSLLIGSPDSFNESESESESAGGVCFNYITYPEYFSFNVQGQTFLDGNLVVTGDISTNNIYIQGKEIDSISLPTGSIITFAGANGPSDGYLLCDGAQYPISDYEKLSNTIGTLYNADVTEPDINFNVPDLRNKFIYGGTNEPDSQGVEVGNSGSVTLTDKQIPELSGNFMIRHGEKRTPMIWDYSGCWTDEQFEPQPGQGNSWDNPASVYNSYQYTSNGVTYQVPYAFGAASGQFSQPQPDGWEPNSEYWVGSGIGDPYMKPGINVAITDISLGTSSNDQEPINIIPPSITMGYWIKF